MTFDQLVRRVHCAIYGHSWKTERPVNAKHGEITWYCTHCPKRVTLWR